MKQYIESIIGMYQMIASNPTWGYMIIHAYVLICGSLFVAFLIDCSVRLIAAAMER